VDWVMGTGQDRTHMLSVTPDGKRIYTTNSDSDTVSIFENVLPPPPLPPSGVMPPGAKAHMDWIQTLIPVAKAAKASTSRPTAASCGPPARTGRSRSSTSCPRK
ncbi:hypothetical protein ACYOEI_23735, partial [Singulisphaera rosea]